MEKKLTGKIFDIQRWSLHDGPGIRTNVFFKGCPLRCQWCSNPESQESCFELAFFQDKCIGCKSCLKNCPYGGIQTINETLKIDVQICRQHCYEQKGGGDYFLCSKGCYAEALEVMGKEVTVKEILDEVIRDKGIYQSSGGGLTVTGGEPFAQPIFLRELLQEAKKCGLHTAIESCMYAEWEQIEACLSDIDFIFMDFKILDEEKHRFYTGIGTEKIRNNMKKISSYCADHSLKFAIRTPVIPGVNDSPEEIGGIADWIRENLEGISDYQLLPYHRLGRGKYANIQKIYQLPDVKAPEKEKMWELEAEISKRGFGKQ